MANLKASKKDIKRIVKRTERNRQVKSRIKTLAKNVAALVKEGKPSDEIKTAAKEYISVVDKAAKRNIIHKNKADREKHNMSAHIFIKAES